jgi:phage major head subunit gpT-like protein
MSAALRSQYTDLYGSTMLPVLEEIFRSRLDRHPQLREQLFKTVKASTSIYQSSEIHDMPMFSEIAEASEYNFFRTKQGANKTVTVLKKGLGFAISEEAIEDGKFDLVGDAIAKMADSAKESQEISAMNIFNNGFSTETTADGQNLFATGHTLPSGLTFRNKLSVDADLSVTSLDQALQDFETQFIGDSGIIKRIQPKVLLVAPSSRRYAMELIGSDLKADTADNNMNSFQADGLKVMVSPHLTDSDAWFILGSPDETGLRIVSRKGIETKAAGDAVGWKNDAVYYKSRFREACAALHPYGVFGSTGA